MRVLAASRPALLVLGLVGGTLLLVVVAAADRWLGRDVLMIVPHDPAAVEMNRSLFLPGDPVPAIYGNPMRERVRVIAPDPEHLIRPDEDPSLLLLRVDKGAGENPLQARTLWFLARYLVPLAWLVGLAGLVLPRRHGPPPRGR
jgi:hypothetical protein